MRTKLMKQLLGVAGLLAATLLGGVAAEAATTVNLTAQRASLTLPDGTVTPMWSYCGAAAAGSAGITTGGGCVSATAGALPTWTQGPTIMVPAGDTLTIMLANSLPSPTSVTILGQFGGGIGMPVKVSSPAHTGATVSSQFSQVPTANPFTPPAQGPRARAFAPEADGIGAGAATAGSQTYVWSKLKPGTYLYESGSRPSLQVPMGLYGLLIVTAQPNVTPAAGAASAAYAATSTVAGTSVNYPLSYDADASFLFSEVDVAQNSAVDAAALAMAATTAPTLANKEKFAALEQRKAPAAATALIDPGFNANDKTLADCSSVACYPPAVNYAPTWFLLNGHSFDRSNPALTAAIVADAPANANGRVLVRLANAGLKTHIPTIVGLPTLLVAEDGNLLPDVALGLSRSAGALVSGKVQSAVLLTAGKTTDVVVSPGLLSNGQYADAAYAVLDRELSLSGGGKSFGGLQGFLAFAPAGTSQATLGGVLATGSTTPILPAALAVAANPDTFNVPATASKFSGNVLLNDIGVTGVVAGSTAPAHGSVSFKVDGTFSYVAASAAIVNDSFSYCGNLSPANPGGVCATVTLVATDVGQDKVTALPQTFTSGVASLLRVPHPGVLSGAASTGSYTLAANDGPAAPATTPVPGYVLPFSTPKCTGSGGSCAVQLFADGAFNATASAPGTYTFAYYAVDAQGQSASNTVTLVFPPGSGVKVGLTDSVTGQALPSLPLTGVQDYRWVIEEDQTFLHDPGNPGFVPSAFTITLPSLALVPGSQNQVLATYSSSDANFKGFVAGTYVQIAGSTTDAFNGVYRINSVNGGASSGSFTYTLWISPPAGSTLSASSGTGTTAQSLATNFHRSYMPLVASGCTGPRSCNSGQFIGGAAGAALPVSLPSDVVLDPTKRYFISVLPGDAGDPAAGLAGSGHAMGAAPVLPLSVGGAGWAPVTVLLPRNPLPPGQMSIFVFEDNNPISGDVDDGEPGLGGFEVVIYDTRGSSGDQAGQITYDLFNQPLTNALANQGGTGTDGAVYANLCPTTPNGATVPVGVIYTCLPVLDKNGRDVSPFTGMALVKNVIPGRIDVQAHPAAWRGAAGEQWIQVSTLEGTPNTDTFVHAGEPAYWQEFGPPGFHSFIGFVNPAHLAQANNQAVVAAQKAGIPIATVTGRVTNLHMDRPPQAKLNDSCQPGTADASCARAALNYTQCYVALNSQAGNGAVAAWAPCNADGTFSISNVPQDTYELFIWDEWLDQIKAKQLVTIPQTNADGTPFPLSGGVIATGDIPVFNWFTRIQETIYVDLNGNGMRDPGEPGLSNLVANVRFRDGTFSNRLTTDAQGNAFHNELFPLFNWYVLENDQTRYKNTGVHIIYDAGGIPDQTNLSANNGLSTTEYFPTLGVLNSTETYPVPDALRIPGALYNTGKTERIDPPNWITEGLQGYINQTEFVEWGKQPFAPGENGGISGMIYFASVRAFDDPRLKVQNLSEPGIPRVQVNLYQRITNADGSTSDTLVDSTTSSSWDDWANGTTNGVPNMACPGNAPAAAHPPAYVAGAEDPFINYTLGSNNQYKCYDGQHAFNQVQPAVYDGYYAFPTGNCTVCTAVPLLNMGTNAPLTNPDGTAAAPVPTLPPGQYVVEVVRPDGFEITKEEDKNILIGDTWISAGPQQFGNLVNIFILPDQATLNDSNPAGQTLFAPPCAGLPHLVPDYLTVVPEALQVAPYAGQIRNLCDKKLVTVSDQTASNADFQLWTPAPIAGHVSGLMLNDAAAEFDPYSPSFGEKFALPNAPISVRDFNGVEILRAYTDKWGTFDFLNVSTWEANVPNPSGYAPNMLTYCMNDPGPTAVPGQSGKFQVDPYYNPQYSDFCYNWPILPGVTTYLDTPVLPVAAFASHYAPVDCQYANLTPAILRVDGNWVPTAGQAFLPPLAKLPTTGVGPYVDLAASAPQLSITALGDVSVLNPAFAGPTTLPDTPFAANRITRHYGFGASAGAKGKVQLIAARNGKATTLPITSWSDQGIVASIPANGATALATGDYQLVITAANGVNTVDTVTVSIDNSALGRNHRAPWYVAAPAPGTGIGAGQGYGLPHPIQDAIDSSKVLPGDLVIVDAGLYPELDVMWKPLRLQGVGAAAVTIQASKYPNSKIADWRTRINLLFGLSPDGNPFVDAAGNAYLTQVDPLPGQTVNGGITRLEPSALSTEEGAGITVLAANNQADPGNPSGCLNASQLAALNVQPEANFASATPFGFFPVSTPLAGTQAPPTANQPVAASRQGRYVSDFACYAARIDGLSVTGSDAGGGIYVNGWAHNLQISNNRVFGNSGPYSGGVRIGQPYLEAQVVNDQTGSLSYDINVKIHHNAITTNGTDEANAAPGQLVGSSGAGGGLAIEAGSDNFSVQNNWICGNFSAGDGGGMGVVGNSTPGLIAHNTIIFNESYQQTGPSYGGGLAIEGEPATGATASTGVGNISVDGNLIQGNAVRSGSGGGIRLAAINGAEIDQEGHHWSISLTNNVIANNVAGWTGGGVSLADAAWVTLVGNTIANNDAVGVAGVLMNTPVGKQSTGPATAVPGPAGVASDPDSAALQAVLARLGGGKAPKSRKVSQPSTMSNNIIWHNRSFFFDASSGTVQLCASNQWSDALNHRCTPLVAQAATGQCDTSHAAYWDVGVTGDQKVNTGSLALDHSVLSVSWPGVGNQSSDPLFQKGYCNGGRVNPGTQFEPGSPFQPPFGINAAATLDESGNYVDLSFGPLSLNDPANPLAVNGDYHLQGATSPAVDAGAVPTAAVVAATGGAVGVDIDGDSRPQGAGYDIGADEYVPPYVDIAVSKDDGVASVVQGQKTTYTIVVQNLGNLGASGVSVRDLMPSVTVVSGFNGNGNPLLATATLASTWTCAASSAGASCATASGTGDVNTTVTLPAGGAVTLAVTVTIPSNAQPNQNVTNTVRASVPAGVTDANPGNNVASDTDAIRSASVDLAISKVFASGKATFQPGETVRYTITVNNLSTTTTAAFSRVNDTPPALLSGAAWSCVASSGSSCGAASGSGRIQDTAASIAPLGTLTYTLSGVLPFGAANNTAFSNTATVAVNGSLYSDPVSANNSATANGSVAFGRGTFSPSPAGVPATQTGQTGQALITLSNGGVDPLQMGTASVSGTALSLAASTCTAGTPLAAGASCTYTVQFKPTVAGPVTGSLTVISGAGTLTDSVTALGTAPVIVVGSATLAVSPSPLALTTAPANTQTKNALLTLSNTGTAPLNLTGASASNANLAIGRFSVTFGNGASCPNANGALSGTLAAGSSCTLNVRYVPVSNQSNSSVLTISTPGAATSSTTVNLSGN